MHHGNKSRYEKQKKKIYICLHIRPSDLLKKKSVSLLNRHSYFPNEEEEEVAWKSRNKNQERKECVLCVKYAHKSLLKPSRFIIISLFPSFLLLVLWLLLVIMNEWMCYPTSKTVVCGRVKLLGSLACLCGISTFILKVLLGEICMRGSFFFFFGQVENDKQ